MQTFWYNVPADTSCNLEDPAWAYFSHAWEGVEMDTGCISPASYKLVMLSYFGFSPNTEHHAPLEMADLTQRLHHDTDIV